MSRITSDFSGRRRSASTSISTFTDHVNDPSAHISYTNLLSCPQIEDASFNSSCPRSSHKSCHRITDIGEVTRCIQISQVDGVLDKCLGDDGGNDSPGRLPRSKGVERADSDHRQVVSAIKTFSQFIRTDLAGRVGRLPLEEDAPHRWERGGQCHTPRWWRCEPGGECPGRGRP